MQQNPISQRIAHGVASHNALPNPTRPRGIDPQQQQGQRHRSKKRRSRRKAMQKLHHLQRQHKDRASRERPHCRPAEMRKSLKMTCRNHERDASFLKASQIASALHARSEKWAKPSDYRIFDDHAHQVLGRRASERMASTWRHQGAHARHAATKSSIESLPMIHGIWYPITGTPSPGNCAPLRQGLSMAQSRRPHA